MEQIRILHIVPSLYNGGVGSFLRRYYSRFDKNRFKFDFATHYDERGKVAGDPLLTESKIYYLIPQHVLGTIKYLQQLRLIIKHENYDIVHIHLGHMPGFVAMFCKWFGAKITVCHAHTTRCMNPKMKYFMPVLRWMARHYSEQLMACGGDAGRFCYGTDNFVVIPNGIDFDVYKTYSAKDTLKLKAEFGIDEGSFVAGCVAAFTPPKNHNYLIRVFKAMHDENRNCVLMLVGDGGGLKEKVKEQVHSLSLDDCVIFAGSQVDIPKFLSAFDVFLLPSIHEGLPVVAAEAQSMGLKCVFSKQIDNTCDRNLGLMTFLPITDEAIPHWVEESFKYCKRPSRDEIKSQFTKDYYDIVEGTKMFQNEYIKLMEKKSNE